ncbi:uncharacterized protein [Euwallacea fornicatus]|uniref:uncharacterized protein n=1 Tax=Euwallacea fornicatus TaxID=995702 RepID=UPI00338FDDCF
MWSVVMPDDLSASLPASRSKHSATLFGEHIYVLGGRNGNLALKDYWKYNLVTGKWHQLKPSGEKLPCLQEHTAVAYKDHIFVFGGEISFSSSTETPLWVYDVKADNWRKVKTKKGLMAPKGRRGHSALVHNGTMFIYGGYQDLKGSSGEVWAFHFDTESWHLISTTPTKHADQYPPPRHKHSAVIHGEAMWIYGGMSDLHERGDLWKFDIYTKIWTNVKTKLSPGPLHSHTCCKMPSSMVIFGGERNGQCCNDLWKFNFDSLTWEKLTFPGLTPQPRSESRSFVVSELILKGSNKTSLEARTRRIRRTCNSADRGNRHSSYLPNNRIAPYENTYIFEPTEVNYNDGSNLAQQYAEPNKNPKGSLLQEISKLSQINLSRIHPKCSYSMLSKGKATDSTESLIRQNTSPQKEMETGLTNLTDANLSTPSRGTMVKSKSAYVIKKKYLDISPSSEEEVKELSTIRKKRVGFDSTVKKIPRDPISVPNFSALTLPTPVLTPVEASKLVYLTDEETDIDSKLNSQEPEIKEEINDDFILEYENLQPLKRGDSYTSHLAYADNPLYQEAVGEKSQENVSSTSDYCSIETVNRLSSASSYSMKTNTPQEEILNKNNMKEDSFGFCNPNYMRPSMKSMLTAEEKTVVNKMLSNTHQASNPPKENEGETMELISFNGSLNKNTKVVYRQSCRSIRPWNLPLNKNIKFKASGQIRAHSAGRAERNKQQLENKRKEMEVECVDAFVPFYIYIVGGKEQGQVTVFQRPISIWRLKLF